MNRLTVLALMIAAPLAPGVAHAETLAAHPEASPYDESVSDALYAEKLDQAIAQLEPGHLVLAVFGANWCHDSRALAGWLTSPAFDSLLDAHFEVVFIDVGRPQAGQGRNLDLAARFGVTGIEGTPNLLVIDSEGVLVNSSESAQGWRNAASRSEEAVYAILESYAVEQE